MTAIETLMEVAGSEAQTIDAVMREDLDTIRLEVDALLSEVLEYSLFNGGKRIRPLLVVLAARLCGGQEQRTYLLAVAFEYLHVATLLHDDVIDNAETRRGRPAVSHQYGLISAILAGDFLHARSMRIVGEIAGKEGLRVFCDATAGMVDGEFMQLRNTSRASLSEPDYYEAIMGKTGLLIAAACEVGAIFAKGSSTQQLALKQYGAELGSAFQMIDDLLDYTGSQEKTGKAVGNDLLEGKITLPLIIALARAEPAQRQQLEEILQQQRLRQTQFQFVAGIVEKYGGFEETRKRAEEAAAKAVNYLQEFTDPAMSAEKTVLEALAQYILNRDK